MEAMGNRDKLLQAARECLLTIGYARTTVRDIAAASGANQASVNYHFGSKEKLLGGALHDLNREWGEVLFAALELPGSDGEEELEPDHEALWGRIIASIDANRALWFVNFESVSTAHHDEEIRRMIAQGQALARESLARAFENMGTDQTSPQAVHRVGSHYYSLLVGVALQRLTDPENAPTATEIAAGPVASRS
jgi:AcrR family transcriptional regulator